MASLFLSARPSMRLDVADCKLLDCPALTSPLGMPTTATRAVDFIGKGGGSNGCSSLMGLQVDSIIFVCAIFNHDLFCSICRWLVMVVGTL